MARISNIRKGGKMEDGSAEININLSKGIIKVTHGSCNSTLAEWVCPFWVFSVFLCILFTWDMIGE